MPLAETASTITRPAPYRPQCSIARLLATLDAADQAWLVAALDDRKAWPANDLSDIIAEDGHDRIRAMTIRRHRKRFTSSDGCACP